MKISFKEIDKDHPFEAVLEKIRNGELLNVSVSFTYEHTQTDVHNSYLGYKIEADINDSVVLKALKLR